MMTKGKLREQIIIRRTIHSFLTEQNQAVFKGSAFYGVQDAFKDRSKTVRKFSRRLSAHRLRDSRSRETELPPLVFDASSLIILPAHDLPAHDRE